MDVDLLVCLTPDQPEHVWAELECDIQRVSVGSYGNNLFMGYLNYLHNEIS